MELARRNDADAPMAIAAIATLAAIMPITVLVAPLLVGQLITQFQFSASEAGYLLSIELAAMCTATIIALTVMKRISWRRVLTVCLAVAVIGNMLSGFVSNFMPLALLRAFVGLGSGTIMSFCLAGLGQTTNKDRNFGIWLIAQLASAVTGLFILPLTFSTFGMGGYYIGTAIIQIAMFALIPYFYDGHKALQHIAHTTSSLAVSRIAIAGMVSIFLIYIAIAGVWAYVERIGHAAGMSAQWIGVVLAFGTGVGLIGASCATAIGGRLKRSRSILAGFVILLIGVALFIGHQSDIRYITAAGFFKFAWTFIVPFMLAAVSTRDPSGKLIVISNFVLAGGIATGPAVSAFLLNQGFGYDFVLLVMIGVILISAAIILVPELHSERDSIDADPPSVDLTGDFSFERH